MEFWLFTLRQNQSILARQLEPPLVVPLVLGLSPPLTIILVSVPLVIVESIRMAVVVSGVVVLSISISLRFSISLPHSVVVVAIGHRIAIVLVSIPAPPLVEVSIVLSIGIGFRHSFSISLPHSVIAHHRISIESTVEVALSTVIVAIAIVVESVVPILSIGLRLCHNSGKSESYDNEDFHDCLQVGSKIDSPC